MNKIFRLHNNGSETVEDWQETQAIQDVHIRTIPDPAGAKVSHEITAIPTPFARIDIAKNAYRQVNSLGQPDGTTIYHKVVSDCLDVLEIFFQAPLLGNTLEIIPWNSGIRMQGSELTVDPFSDLGQLLGATSNASQRLFGQTLRMFFQQDASAYNFNELRQIYLLNYSNGPSPLNIIGGTSPATLTFSSGNDLSFVNISLGDRKAFAGPPRALNRRSEEFIYYVFALQASIRGFNGKFGEVNEYLNNIIFPRLPEALQHKVRGLNEAVYTEAYTDIAIATSGAGNHPEILGFPLKGIAGLEEQLAGSDFTLRPGMGKKISGKLPFVLPAYAFPKPLNYVGSAWSPETRVPTADPEPLEKRRLPGLEQVVHPYLTVSDFLEDYLIRLPFAADPDAFFNGHLAEETGCLLPLKKELFRYFSIEDIQGVVPGTGVKMFELKKGVAGSIEAILRVPVQKNNFIELKRAYKVSQSLEMPLTPAAAENKGVVSEHALTVAVYPFLKTGSDRGANYRVLLADADKELHNQHLRYGLKFYKDDASVSEVTATAVQRKQDKTEQYFSTDIYVLDREFDLIEVTSNLPASGLLLPKFKKVTEGLQPFTFAVDFGTTNTYIAYNAAGNSAPQSFTMGGKDSQVGLLHLDTEANYNRLRQVRAGLGVILRVQEADLLPATIGNAQYHFPHRTVLAESLRLGRTDTAQALAGNNISFTYELRDTAAYQESITNLKWAKNDPGGRSRTRIGTFIEELVMLIRNKILLNGGSVETARIVWFYPSSMTVAERGRLENIWYETTRKYLSPQTRLESLSESAAPFYYYKNSGLIVGNSQSVNIDIGGGTTDIVLFKGEQPMDSTSFRFAGNAIFGDGYGGSAQDNGFVQAFEKAQLRKVLDDPNLTGDFGAIYDMLKKKQSSDDVISFLFTLRKHPEYQHLGVSLTRYLQEHAQLKVVPLLAFAAILYHTAQWIKSRGYERPQRITFSGSGSRFLDILDESRQPQFKNLAFLVDVIFNTVYGITASGMELRRTENPKEVTAQGGLYRAGDGGTADVTRSILAMATAPATEQPLRYADLHNHAIQENATAEVVQFLNLFSQWNQQLKFRDLFGADVSVFSELFAGVEGKLHTYLEEGINRKQKEGTTEPDEALRETLFFFPIIPLLHQLAFRIAQKIT